jgi:hypothetical protein
VTGRGIVGWSLVPLDNTPQETCMEPFKFGLGARVRLAMSGEQGMVIGRGEYLDSNPQYFVRYLAADGRQVEAWWSGDAIAADD